MSDTTEPSKIGPDYFSFYTQEVQKLLSLDEDFLPFSSPKASEPTEQTSGDKIDVSGHSSCNGKERSIALRSFSQGIGGRFSDFKKERLKSLLKQTVVSLLQEVDDMLDPVLAIRQLKSQLRSRKSLINHSAAARESDLGEQPRKKMRLSSLSSSESDDEGDDADLLRSEVVNGTRGGCDICRSTESTIQTDPKKSKSLCKLCTFKSKQEKVSSSEDDQTTGSCRASNIEANTESKELCQVDNDLQFLMENNTASVESSIKKYSDELLMTFEHMEQQLEGLLDLLQSSNRLMTLTEKQQLQKLIQKLPPKNLDRVVEIIRRNKPLEMRSPDVIHVDLEEEDNVTLWRLYVYVKTVENARKLAS